MTKTKSIATAYFKHIRDRHVGKVHGMENLSIEGAFIIAHNHGSFMDPILIAALCHPHLDKRTLYFISQIFYIWDLLIRLLLRDRIGTLPINKRNKNRVLDLAADRLSRGDVVAIAPEGPIKNAPGLRRGRTGAARLALRAGVPVVPVGIQTDRCLWSMPRLLKWAVKPKNKAEASFGKALRFDRHSGSPQTKQLIDSVTQDIMREIGALIGESPD